MIRVLFSIGLLLLCSIGVSTQDNNIPPDENFPTVSALQETTVPVADAVDLARRLRGINNIETPIVARTLSVGDQDSFTVSNSSANEQFMVDATLLAIGEHNYIWVESNSGMTQKTAEDIAHIFDTNVYNQVRDLWGSEPNPGVDADPRVYILFTRRVGVGVGAYFARLHTFPDEIFPASNEHEMFVVNLDAFGIRPSLPRLRSTLAHEFQHMIRSTVDLNEDTWMDEGLSSFTEFYTEGFLPGTAAAFLAMPETQLNTFGLAGTSREVNYGAGLLFLTYFYERFGLDAIKTLGAEPANGLQAVDIVLREQEGITVDEFFADWVLANIIFDGETSYGYPSLGEMAFTPTPKPLEDFLVNERELPPIEGTLPQYATHYYSFDDIPTDSLEITLSLPKTVQLVPIDSFSGRYMWYSNRGDVSDMTLTRAFDLSEVKDATLTYKMWYQIEENWDYAYVMVSKDNGLTWQTLATQNTTTIDPQGYSFGHAYTGSSGKWLDEKIALDDYAGQEVLIRFEQISDDAVNQPGLVIDDVAIPEIGYFSNFEENGGGWQPAGWVRTDNILPQWAWLQIVKFKGDHFIIERQLASGEGRLLIDGLNHIDRVIIAISPFAPVTTENTTYTLNIYP